MFAHAQRHHVVILKDVLLESVQVLALEEHSGDLLLDCACVPDRDDALTDVDAPLPSPLLHLLVLEGRADVAKLLEGRPDGTTLEELRKLF